MIDRPHLPGFGACLALFSDLGQLPEATEGGSATAPRAAAGVRAGLGERLEQLRVVDAEVQRSAASLVAAVETLSLPRSVAVAPGLRG